MSQYFPKPFRSLEEILTLKLIFQIMQHNLVNIVNIYSIYEIDKTYTNTHATL